VLIFDTDRFRWHEVSDVIIGERTRIRVQGMTWYFDEGIVARHKGRSCNETQEAMQADEDPSHHARSGKGTGRHHRV
jgi:hypothetical protein